MANPWEMDWSSSAVPSYGPKQTAPGTTQQPWANRPPKEQLDWQQRAYESGRKRLDNMQDIISQGQDVVGKLDAFGAYNRSSRTGAGYESWQPNFTKGQDERNMESITSELAPKQRVAGSGTTSDRDMTLYLKSLPSIEKPGEVNRAIRLNYQNQLDNNTAKYSFFQDWLNKYQTLDGADDYWMKNKSKLGWKPVPTVTEIQSKLTKGQKQGKMLQNENNKSIINAADKIVGD